MLNPQLSADGRLKHLITLDGLPREIALRRRQYEYYREQLLNFAPAA